MHAENFDVSTVPCILIIFPDGGVEKYEGPHAFRWVEEMASRFAPPPPPVQRRPPPSPQEEEYRPPQELSQEDYEDRLRHPPQEYQKDPEPVQREAPPVQREERSRRKSRSRRPRMRPIAETEQESNKPASTVTSIDDIPMEEEDELADRHRSGRPIARIRKDSGNYEDGEDVFGEPPSEVRSAPTSALRKIQTTRANDPTSLMARADALRKGRDQINQTKPVGPQIQNRP